MNIYIRKSLKREDPQLPYIPVYTKQGDRLTIYESKQPLPKLE